jgi:hypothetical protein
LDDLKFAFKLIVFSHYQQEQYIIQPSINKSERIFNLIPNPTIQAPPNAQIQTSKHNYPLLTSLDSKLDGIIPGLPNLGLKIQIHQLPLLGIPLAIGISIKHQLVGAGIAHFDGGMRQRALGGPLDLVACRLCDEEGLAAALVAVVVEAGLDCKVED